MGKKNRDLDTCQVCRRKLEEHEYCGRMCDDCAFEITEIQEDYFENYDDLQYELEED